MAPAARRQQIIDAAVQHILSTGHSGCTLEQVADAAGISKPLIYKYFPKREDLLKALLEQEFAELRGRGLDTIPRKVSFDRIVRATVESALHYYHERGPMLRLLAADPAVADLTRTANRSARSDTSRYFIERAVDEFQIPRDVATIAVTMVINAPIHSMPYLRRRKVDLQRTVEVWSEFILGGWQAVEARYGKRARKRDPTN
jgi:AcrR family transcriptional regulator